MYDADEMTALTTFNSEDATPRAPPGAEALGEPLARPESGMDSPYSPTNTLFLEELLLCLGKGEKDDSNEGSSPSVVDCFS